MAIAIWYRGERVTDDNSDQMVYLANAKEPISLADASAIGAYLLLEQLMFARETGVVTPEDAVIRLEVRED